LPSVIYDYALYFSRHGQSFGYSIEVKDLDALDDLLFGDRGTMPRS